MIMREYLSAKNLGELLNYLYPKANWVHNEVIPKEIVEERSKGSNVSAFERRNFCPDYRCEEKSIVVEFEGITHYQSSVAYWNDIEKEIYYSRLGYKLIQIPYFVQPTKEIVKLYFEIDVEFDLTEKKNGFNIEDNKSNRNLPSSFSEDGVRRFIVEFSKFDNVTQDEILYTLYENYQLEGISLKILPLSLIKILQFEVHDEDEKYNEAFELHKYIKE